MAGLFQWRAWVCVLPPLGARAPRSGSTPVMLLAVSPAIAQPLRLRMRLWPFDVRWAAVAPQSVPPLGAVLLAMTVFLMLVVSLTPSPPAKLQVLPVIVVLVMVSVPWALRMPPLLATQELPVMV